ncbi:MAG: hypothetical protein KKB51_14315 [Candidatus Riflebacteria bacterium]|nr:hypothetical protein [Candidatus Riflebacteria bacterium]
MFRNNPLKGMTYIELTVAIFITVIITGIAIRIMTQMNQGSEKISKDSMYYQTIGRFLGQVRADLRSATKIEQLDNTIVLTIATDDEGRFDTISFVIDEEKNSIIRNADQQRSTYDFGEPPENAGKFVFKIER